MSSREGLKDNEHERRRRIDPRVGSLDFLMMTIIVALALVLTGMANGRFALAIVLAATGHFVVREIRTSRAPAQEPVSRHRGKGSSWFPALCLIVTCLEVLVLFLHH